MYVVAYSLDGGEIDIIICKNDDELIGAIYDLIQDEDFYNELNTVDDTLSTLEDLMVTGYLGEGFSITIADSSGNKIFQM